MNFEVERFEGELRLLRQLRKAIEEHDSDDVADALFALDQKEAEDAKRTR